MQRSLTATDVSFVSLQSAIFCVQCELLSENNTPRCLACGSGAVLSLSRVLGGSLRGQRTAHLIADAELDRLVRSLLYTVPHGVPQISAKPQIDLPAAATFSTRHHMRPRHHHHGPALASAPPAPIDTGEIDLEPGISIIAEKPIADSRRNACARAKCCFAMTPSQTRAWIGRVAGGWGCAPSWPLRCATSGGRWAFSKCCRRRPTRSTTTM